jgi:hypothetical protein
MKPKQYGWHFLYEGRLLRTGAKAPSVGEWLEVPEQPILCEGGLHGSLHPFDALRQAPGPILTLCEYKGSSEFGEDKFCARRRRIVAEMDGTEMLRFYARMEAVRALEFWPDPPDIVIDWLMSGDESLRRVARESARATVWEARASAWASASAWEAARATAWESARAAVLESAWASAWASARAWGSAWGSARAVAVASSSTRFADLVAECFEGPLASIGASGAVFERVGGQA